MGHAQAIRVDRERASSRAVPIRAVMARRSDVRTRSGRALRRSRKIGLCIGQQMTSALDVVGSNDTGEQAVMADAATAPTIAQNTSFSRR